MFFYCCIGLKINNYYVKMCTFVLLQPRVKTTCSHVITKSVSIENYSVIRRTTVETLLMRQANNAPCHDNAATMSSAAPMVSVSRRIGVIRVQTCSDTNPFATMGQTT